MGVSHTGPVFQGPAFEPTSADDPVTVSGHRIGAVLGEGALGRVYLASAPGGQPVALTVVRQPAARQPDLAARAPDGSGVRSDADVADFEARFHRDAQAAGRVPGGPHTVAVLGSGKEGDRCWIATAYVPAVSLRSAVTGGGPLPTGVVLRLVAGLAEGLRTVHHEGVVHGDLRPAHVLLTAEGPRLKGYGLASLVADPAAGGGPVFLAPEQAAGKPPLAATDVFALGQLAAYASIGTAPFGEGPIDGILPRVQQEEPDLNELPGELREIVTRCLIKDPALRPSLAQITAMCAQASPAAARRRADPWLPPALLAAIPSAPVPFTPPGPHAAAGPAAPPPSPAPGPHQNLMPANAAGPPPSSMPVAPPGLPPAPMPAPPPPGPGPVPLLTAAPPAVPPGAVERWGPHAWPAYVQAALPVRRPRRRTAGVVGAVVALAVAVTAGVALAGGFDADGVAAGQSKGGDVAATTGARPTAPNGGGGATGSAEAPSPTLPPTMPEVYQGFRLPAGYALSWQAGSPVARPGTYSGDFGYTPEADAFATDTNQGTLALIAPQGSGTLEECRAGGLQTPSIPRRLVTAGSRVCVRSADGTTALLTFRQLTAPGAPQPYAVVDVTVWRVTDEAAESDQLTTESLHRASNSAEFSPSL